MTQSQVYRELAAMAERGLVEAGERGMREKQPYTITRAGREAFASWIERLPGDETIRFPLLLTLAFGQHLSTERLATILQHHQLAHAQRVRTYRLQRVEVAGLADPFALATLDFGIAYEAAVLEWCEQLAVLFSDQQEGNSRPQHVGRIGCLRVTPPDSSPASPGR